MTITKPLQEIMKKRNLTLRDLYFKINKEISLTRLSDIRVARAAATKEEIKILALYLDLSDEEKAELYDVIEKTVDEFLEKEKTIWEQKMTTEKMSLEEAINVVDAMYQDRYKIIEENDTVYVDRLKDVKFTNLEFASVILLRGIQSLQSKLNNSIPKQVVIDKIEELDIAILECEYDDDDVEEYKNDVEKEKRILLIKKSALEELLEEK